MYMLYSVFNISDPEHNCDLCVFIYSSPKRGRNPTVYIWKWTNYRNNRFEKVISIRFSWHSQLISENNVHVIVIVILTPLYSSHPIQSGITIRICILTTQIFYVVNVSPSSLHRSPISIWYEMSQKSCKCRCAMVQCLKICRRDETIVAYRA